VYALALGPEWLRPDTILTWLGPWALVGLALIIFAECGLLLGFFLPGDSLLFTAGLLSSTAVAQPLPLPLVLVSAVAGALLGAQVGFWIGRRAGPALTDQARRPKVAEAMARWPLSGVIVIHRHGRLVPGDRIVFVGTASSHRAAALDGCAFLIDWAKTKAPLWKQELFADGTARWVEPRLEDDVAAAEWDASAEHGKP